MVWLSIPETLVCAVRGCFQKVYTMCCEMFATFVISQSPFYRVVFVVSINDRQYIYKIKSNSIGNVTIDQCIGGARSVKCMLWETSNLDPDEGIRFRGFRQGRRW
jgi:hypothetical protein